jgi:hypothetical protein
MAGKLVPTIVLVLAVCIFYLFRDTDKKDNIKACSGPDCIHVTDVDVLFEGTSITLKEDIAKCPKFLRGNVLGPVYGGLAGTVDFLDRLLYKVTGRELFGPNWADSYIVASYLIPIRVLLGLYSTRDKSYIHVPTTMLMNETVGVEHLHVPHTDIDGSPNFFWFENYLPEIVFDKLYVPALTCFYGSLRDLPWDDDIEDDTINTWEAVLQSGRYKRKVDWVMGFYNNAKCWSGEPIWPKQMVDFEALFLKGNHWDDGLESAWAFQLIATHRVEESTRSFGGEVLPFVVPLNNFSKLAVRKGFAKFGGDLYFNAEGFPVLLETPTGKHVQRGDKDWQYWKFAWRSSLITVITLVDHLHFTHFKVANMYARITRMALPPNDPYRRLLSIFTFGHIFVNMQALHMLIGQNHMLHRASPLQDLESLSGILAETMPDMQDWPALRALQSDEHFDRLPQKLKDSPFYADGRVFMRLLTSFVKDFDSIVLPGYCSRVDSDFTRWSNFSTLFVRMLTRAHYSFPAEFGKKMEAEEQKKMCAGLLNGDLSKEDARLVQRMRWDRLGALMFVVSGWHRHVGFVGDYYKDPEVAAMSWKEGEPYARPRQHMIQTVINTFTSTGQPKLIEDFSHVFKGLEKEAELASAWRNFIKRLGEMGTYIDKKNDLRPIKNINMHPSVLESAVSK